LASLPPEVGVQALHLQTQDSTQLLFMAMVSLARDVYTRVPGGTREFEEFLLQTDLSVVDESGEKKSLAYLLQNR
jgi:hypothetical protein